MNNIAGAFILCLALAGCLPQTHLATVHVVDGRIDASGVCTVHLDTLAIPGHPELGPIQRDSVSPASPYRHTLILCGLGIHRLSDDGTIAFHVWQAPRNVPLPVGLYRIGGPRLPGDVGVTDVTVFMPGVTEPSYSWDGLAGTLEILAVLPNDALRATFHFTARPRYTPAR
jgi:hypothetical protein